MSSTDIPQDLLTECHESVPVLDNFSERISKIKDIIVFNVGGTRFEVLKSSFAYWPTTRLSRLVRAETEEEILGLCDGYVRRSTPGIRYKEEYYFNRDWSNFNSILNLYRNRKLHSTALLCCMNYHGDLEYWGIDKILMDACCAIKHCNEMDMGEKEVQIETEKQERKQAEKFGKSRIGQTRKFVFNLTEHPDSSVGARVRKCN